MIVASPSPRDQAAEVMARVEWYCTDAVRQRHLGTSAVEWDDADPVEREAFLDSAYRQLDALAAARRQETCPTCLGNTMKYLDLMYCPNPDCTNGTVDAGSLAVQWLVEAGVIEYEPAWHGPVLSEVAPHVS